MSSVLQIFAFHQWMLIATQDKKQKTFMGPAQDIFFGSLMALIVASEKHECNLHISGLRRQKNITEILFCVLSMGSPVFIIYF